MATFQQRENGWWQAKVRRKGWPAESKTFRTKTEAQDWARQVEADIRKGVFLSSSDAEKTTFGQILKQFTDEYAPKHYRQRDDKKEAWRFQCDRLNEVLGEYSLAAIDQKLVTKYRDERSNPPAGSGRRAVGDSTVRKDLYMLSKVLKFAESDCGILLPRGNPVAKIRKPADSKARERRLSPDEWTTLTEECKSSRNPWLAPALEIAVETAMRQGEMLSLDWANVDTKRRIALLPQTKNGEARAVPLSSRVVAVLENLPRPTNGLVIPVERMTLHHAFDAACLRAGIQNFTWHDIRHEALSRLAERGDLNVLELAAVSGHKTLQMLKRYTHLQAEKLAQKLG